MGLTRQLEELDAELSPTVEQWTQKQWVNDTFKPLLERHTGGVLHMFGSCANGFWMKGSDVDACLVLRRCTQKQAWITKLRLVQCLVERERLGTVQVVRGARVPVSKICSIEGGELCDVSINNVAALENSRFVGVLAALDPRVPSLGRIIKHWASRRRINNRSEGTLSTYTLMLQLFYFLQLRQVLPRVADLLTEEAAGVREGSAAGGAAEDVLARTANAFATGPEMDETTGQLRPLPFMTEATGIQEMSRFCNTESIGQLLHGFFQLWGREEFSGRAGGGRDVFVYDSTQEENDLGVLVMRCPLTGKNVNPFTASVWRAIHAEFERAALLLSQGHSLQELCQPAEESPAGRGPRTRL